MEYMNKGNLSDLFNFIGHMNNQLTLKQRENLGIYLSYEIIKILDHLHKKHKISHRDIKPENVCISRSNKITVIDFGLAVKNDQSYQANVSLKGVNKYMSPQAFVSKYLSCKFDVFSVGVLLYMFIYGEHPYFTPDEFERFNERELGYKYNQLIKDNWEVKFEKNPSITSKLLSNMIALKEEKRYSLGDFLREFEVLTSQTLQTKRKKGENIFSVIVESRAYKMLKKTF